MAPSRPRASRRGATALLRMSLYATVAGGVEGFYAADNAVWQLTDAMGTPTTTSTGVAASAAAGGRDATGPYIWTRQTGQIVQRRPPSWAPVGSAITIARPGRLPDRRSPWRRTTPCMPAGGGQHRKLPPLLLRDASVRGPPSPRDDHVR